MFVAALLLTGCEKANIPSALLLERLRNRNPKSRDGRASSMPTGVRDRDSLNFSHPGSSILVNDDYRLPAGVRRKSRIARADANKMTRALEILAS
jgi:hypothetical protein